jgi:hypothetical protein
MSCCSSAIVLIRFVRALLANRIGIPSWPTSRWRS